MTSHRRRSFLASAGSATALAVAGCMGDDEPTQTADGGGGETLDTHPAAVDAAEWPLLGPELGSADGTLIVFDDVSCPRCAAFHDETLSTIRADHVDSGEVSLVARPYPVVYDWGGPAAHALEATYDRDAEAFWGLQAHYFDEQGEFDADNVLDRTESWLAANTSLDAAAVVDDADSGQFDDRIDSTLQAGEETDAGGVTPVTFVFDGDELATTLTGSVSYVTIQTVLGL